MLKKMKKMLKNERGLTLVELLAVIVILGIIAAIAVPSIGGIISKSKEDAKVAEALQIIDAAKLAYAEDSTIKTWEYSPAANSTNGNLKPYLSKVSDDSFTVKITADNQYTIAGHESAKIVDSSYTDATDVTEQSLADKVK
ncbi:type II secretion system protein [Rossellomorea sp. AcN35-11]|nr:type II secretion system GspH family protein [Rossellomorea aquimaris]WJV27882.1 type II secretion system protein [Rossellomorea sp. AcN35-11]